MNQVLGLYLLLSLARVSIAFSSSVVYPAIDVSHLLVGVSCSDVVLEARPWPRGSSRPNFVSLALALKVQALALKVQALALALSVQALQVKI